MKKIICFSLLALLLIGATSCATLFSSSNKSIAIRSTPENAEIYINGERMGSTPLQLELDASKTYSIEYRKEGYKPITKHLKGKVGVKWVILDILGGMMPIVVDAVTGDWYQFDTDAVNTLLDEE